MGFESPDLPNDRIILVNKYNIKFKTMTHLAGSLWKKWDLHIHTNASDGKGTCEEIIKEALNKGISCIAVTDHHTVANVDEMKTR